MRGLFWSERKVILQDKETKLTMKITSLFLAAFGMLRKIVCTRESFSAFFAFKRFFMCVIFANVNFKFSIVSILFATEVTCMEFPDSMDISFMTRKTSCKYLFIAYIARYEQLFRILKNIIE